MAWRMKRASCGGGFGSWVRRHLGYVQGSPLGQGNADLFRAPVGLRSVEADRRKIPRRV